MISLIFAIIFLILFVFFCIAGGNYMLRNMVDNVLSKNNKENFSNINDLVNPVDECQKTDMEMQKVLNFQTATNIPLSPNNYKNYIGSIYIDDKIEKKN